MCHQSVEKMLKAVFVSKFNKMPPYTHKLDKLTELVELDKNISDDQNNFIDQLTPLNIQARYPLYKEAIYKLIVKKRQKKFFHKQEN